MGFLNILLAICFVSGFSANALGSDIQGKAKYLCDIALNQKPLDYKNNFSPAFIKALPEEYLQGLTLELIDAVGACTKTEELVINGNEAKYKFISKSLRYVAIEFSVDKSNLIDGMLIKDVVFPDVVLSTWQDVKTYSNTWSGISSISIKNFSKSISVGKNNSELQPLGSGFKLYVLGALVDQIHSGSLQWDQTFPIRADWKSLPSGVMQDWADGKMVSLKTYADYMIKISDNTATDHLINIVGRNTVESQVSLMKNSFDKLNRPFLTTAEMFKIKWASPLNIINSFISGDENVKRDILQKEIATTPLEKVGTNAVSMETPSFVREIEWFGSTDDLCEAMKSLKEKNSPEILDSLSKNVPNLNLGANSPWSYGGYKGGSEPGVVTVTYLVQNKNSDWGCISVAWHNEKQVINTWVFSDFVGKVLKLAENYF